MKNKGVEREIMKMDLEELDKYFEGNEVDLYFRLKMIRVTIENIKDIILFCNENKDKIKGTIIQETIKNPHLMPADFLFDYIILEIDSFYEIIKRMNNSSFPLIPEYKDLLHELRNNIAHKDDRQNLHTIKEWMELRKKLSSLRSSEDILEDFFEYYNKCSKIHKDLK